MKKEMQIDGCVELPENMTFDEFYTLFIRFIEQNGCFFGGGLKNIVNGFYVDDNGNKIKPVNKD